MICFRIFSSVFDLPSGAWRRNKRDCVDHVGFFHCRLYPGRQRGRRKKRGGGGDWWMAAVHSPCQEAAENLACQVIGVRPYWCAIGKPVAHFRSCNFIIPRTAPVQHPPLMASPPNVRSPWLSLDVYASKLGTVQDDSGQDCVEGNYITCQHGSLRMVMPPTTCKASGRKPSGSITS